MSSSPADSATIRAPGAHLMALEWRAPFEAMSTVALWPLLMRGPRGDGHSVLVLPGLAAPDSSTGVLRRFLLQRGYRPHRWQQGFNFGPRPGVLEACLERLQSLHRSSGRKISLIGWSLGGVYARELAKMAPDAVRCAISLGTPFAGPPKATNAWRVYEFVSGQRVGEHALHAGLHEAPPVPTTFDLQPHRWRGGVALQRPGAGAACREHRGACQPCRHGGASGSAACGRRPACAARWRLAAVSRRGLVAAGLRMITDTR